MMKSKLVVPIAISLTTLIFVWILFVSPAVRKVNECEDHTRELNVNINSLKEDRVALNDQITSERSELKDKAKILKDLQQSFDQSKDTCEAEKLQLSERADSLQVLLDEAKAQVNRLVEHVDDLSVQIESSDELRQQIDVELQNTRAQLANVTNQLTAAFNRVEELENMVDELTLDVVESENREASCAALLEDCGNSQAKANASENESESNKNEQGSSNIVGVEDNEKEDKQETSGKEEADQEEANYNPSASEGEMENAEIAEEALEIEGEQETSNVLFGIGFLTATDDYEDDYEEYDKKYELLPEMDEDD